VSADPDPSGTWVLYQTEENDGTFRDAPASVTVKYVIDLVAQTLTAELYDHTSSWPFESSTYNYQVQQSGNWFFENSGPGGGGNLEVTVEQPASNELVLTRVAYDGPSMVTAPASVYDPSVGPPPGPGTKPVPRALILRR
jgi:hypothetical protein